MLRTHGVFIPGGPQPDISQFVDGAYVASIWPTREYHSTVVKLEDLGWEIRDSLKVYLYETSYQIALLRKPHSGRVIDNLRIHGAGALNIDDNRVVTSFKTPVKTLAKPAAIKPRYTNQDSRKILKEELLKVAGLQSFD